MSTDNIHNDTNAESGTGYCEMIENEQRRVFIKRLVKAGAIAPVAIVLHDASISVAVAY